MVWTLAVALLLSVVSIVISIWAFKRLQTELRALALKSVSEEQLSAMAGRLTARLDELESRIETKLQDRDEHAQWLAEAESLNLNRRGQVLRLHRRGESAADIASALRVGQGEVKLIIKVFEMGKDFSGPESKL